MCSCNLHVNSCKAVWSTNPSGAGCLQRQAEYRASTLFTSFYNHLSSTVITDSTCCLPSACYHINKDGVYFREQVLENLSREDLGSFIIRESTTHHTCFALSVKVPKFNNPTGIAHYIIHRTPSLGFKIKVRLLLYIDVTHVVSSLTIK